MTEVLETVWIPMPDGTRLAARLWLPDGARQAPVPCILEYIPYRRRDRTRLRDESTHPHFAEAGYASIRVDQRGSGDSEGLMEDEYAEIETQDGVDVIAWIAAQDWCDGNVGMFGKSWGAYNSFQVAARRPPALKAIVPVAGTDDRWREDIHFYGGCLANDNFWWGSIMQLYNAMPPDPEIVGEDRWLDMWRARLEGQRFWPAMWLEHQTHDAMWRRGSICENYADVEIPVYFFSGWFDIFRDTPFRIAEHLSGPVKVMMGPWAHLYPHEGIPEPKVDFIAEVLRFWDHWLKGRDTGLMDEPPLRFYLQEYVVPAARIEARPGRWVEEPSWPSPNVETRTLWLNAGTLGDAKETGGAPMAIRSPQTFGSAAGDMTSFAVPGDIPGDCRKDAGGALLFRLAPQDVPLDILGQPVLQLQVAADQSQGIVAALLVDEAPDGTQALIARGFCNLTHRESDTAPTPVAPGETMAVTVPFPGTAHRLAPGHRLMVQIASCYWPALWPAPAPVTLTLAPGASTLALPLRRAPVREPTPRALPAPPPQPPRRMTSLRPGSMERSETVDLVSGAHTQRTFVDGGVFGPIGTIRIDDIGTELSDRADRRYTITPDDPLSAKATMTQMSCFERGAWKARIETYSEQTATATEFHLVSRLKAWSGEELIFEEEKTHTIPRNGM
ncbi:MAG: CocE/NonD family hydrolase [Pseudomonadota bacterium]